MCLTRLTRLVALVPLVLALAACAADEASDGERPGPQAGAPGECTTEAPAGDDGLTEPGAYVCLGVPIEVPVAERSDLETQGTAKITFTGFEKAPDEVRDSLEELGVRAEDVEGRDLWYFTFEAELLGENSPGGLDGYAPFEFADGGPWADEDARSTLIFSDLPGCPTEDFETADGGTTSTISFCRWWLLGEDDEIHGLRYAPLLLPDYEPLNGSPVTWSASETPADSIPVE